MSRRVRHQWVRSIGQLRRPSEQQSAAGSFPLHRRLRFEPLEDRRLLANVTVGNLNDVVNGTTTSIAALIATPGADGISLREAVLASNADATADTIGFSVSGTIQLTNVGHAGEIAISDNLTISGPGASLLTIRGFNPSATLGDGARIFNIQVPFFTRTVAICGLTLTGGDVASSYGGGAILNSENLTITDCTISGNNAGTTTATFRGGGINNNGGNLSITDSTISGNTSRGRGAGIYSNLGSLSITRSTISGNATNLNSGGGIYSASSTTTIDSSTISGNSAAAGAGIVHDGAGATMTITNSTISGNSATVSGGGIVVAAGSLTVRHSTITGNRADSDNNASGTGGGLFGPATLDHTIVAGNLRSTSTRDDVSGAVVASSAFNLIGVDTGLTGISNGTNGNQIGTGASPIDARLAPLVNNGGPTLTHAFLAGSPAVDTGDPAFVPPPDFDQRGSAFQRVRDGNGDSVVRIDIGAFEQQTTESSGIVVDTLADENDGNYSSGDFSLREAIGLANASIGPDTITFAAALTSGGPGTILLTQGEFGISDALTIHGPGASLLTIDANDPTPGFSNGDGTRIFNIDDASGTLLEVAIIGLTLTRADSSLFAGGAIYNAEHLTVTNSTISGNRASFNSSGNRGGGIYSRGDLTISGSTISGNFVTGSGAGIANFNGNVIVSDSTIGNNTASSASGFYGGGGIFSNGGSLTILRSTIHGNTASLDGGGIKGQSSASITVIDSTISGNSVSGSNGDGGGIFGNNLTIINTTISGNSAENGGAGIACGGNYSSNIVRHSTITANTSFGSPGVGIKGSVTLDHTIVAGNNGASDVSGPQLVSSFSHIGIGASFLSPLADNGGPTKTHALLAGSPAIDAGDPAAVAGVGTVPQFDQRGSPLTRVIDGDGTGPARIDIGAFERHPLPPATPTLLGDYNLNNAVDAADYIVWRKTLGTGGMAAFSGADGNGNGVIDADDHGVWRAHFGQTVPPPGGGAGEASSVEIQELRADALAITNIAADYLGESVVQIPKGSISAPMETAAAAARTASFAALETRSLWHESSTRSRGRIDQYRLAEAGGDGLPLLLAIDRVGRSPRQDSFVSDNNGNCKHRADDDDSESEVDEPLVVALAVR